ncbi:MAG: hypothetical protein AAGM33_06520, partial [Pseudomonadota bacterium]
MTNATNVHPTDDATWQKSRSGDNAKLARRFSSTWKLKLLASGSLTAAACLMATAPASAQTIAPRNTPNQAFQATENFVLGTGNVSISSDIDTVTINAAQTVINWTTLDTADINATQDLINLLPQGTSLVFQGPVSGYTVLNRILPTNNGAGQFRAVAMNGTVQSELGVNGPIGGDIWFYSPGGILVGSDATFDVGSLILTTNNIDTTGGLFGSNGEIRFRGTADSLSAVTIQENADIIADNDGSYVALVAPRVTQGGEVRVNGSTAYVAAEQADLTINNGLFDISITVGTADSVGVEHTDTGFTTGPSAAPIADDNNTPNINEANRDAQAIYLVAVPKNDAITMLVGGDIGYEAATTAGVINGEIVLSAGYNVSVGGTPQSAQVVLADQPVSAFPTNIEFTEGDIRADLTAIATDTIDALINGSTALNIGSNTQFRDYDATFIAGNRVDI